MKLSKYLLALTIATTLLSGCSSMKSVIKEEGKGKEVDEDATLSDSIPIKTKEEDPQLSDVEMSEEQAEILKEAESQDAAAAVKFNETNLATHVQLSDKTPVKKASYLDSTEFAKYISYQLFAYHTNLIDGESFYSNIKDYLHEDFVALLPSKKKDRVEMFSTLQEVFTAQLEKSITNYEISEVLFTHKQLEGYFYRKYTLSNGETIYYIAIIKKDDNGNWLLVGDDPSDGYIATDGQVPTFEQQGVTGK